LKTIDLKTVTASTVLGLLAVLGTGGIASAQGNSGRDKHDQKQYEKNQKALAKAERRRQAEWDKRNSRFETRAVGTGYYTIEPTMTVTAGRYRVNNRNGTWYNTDNRRADLLRQAVNEGYRQGFAAGRVDRNSRRRGSWTNNNVYRSGTYGYQTGVAQDQYQYYFRQGFQRGYQDGSNHQYQDGYQGSFQYGTNNDGMMYISGLILNEILAIRSY